MITAMRSLFDIWSLLCPFTYTDYSSWNDFNFTNYDCQL